MPLVPLKKKNPLGTSDGLYSLARENGLQSQADDIVRLNSGEDAKQIFSGGFISDVFDVLNLASYGTVGLLKGKSFMEGIEQRESFADDDSLGQHGLMGKIGGIMLDIGTDPLTYVAPWTVLGKVPGFAKAGKAIKGRFAPGMVETLIEDGTGRTFQKVGSGELTKMQKATKWLGDKVAWMHGQDPVFREAWERSQRNLGVETLTAIDLQKGLANLEPAISKKLLAKDATGRFMRRPLAELQRELSAEEFAKVAPVWAKIDKLSEELVDLGVLGKDKYEETVGTYIKNAYREHELAKNGPKFNAKSVGVAGTKARKEGLTEEMMQDLGQIDDPAYLAGRAMLDMAKDVEYAKLFRLVNQRFGTDMELDGFVRLPNTRRLQSSSGKIAELRQKVTQTNEAIKPILKELKSALKADKSAVKAIERLEKQISDLGTKRADELTKFFNEGVVTTKVTKKSRQLGTIPDKLQPLAGAIRKYETYDDMYRSADGINLEKAYLEGVLERNGFRSMSEFFDKVKNPYKPEVVKESEDIVSGDMAKIISLQKQIEKLTGKSELLKDIDQKSIANSLIHLEQKLSDLRFKKEDLLEEIDINKMGDLAGKYVPEDMARYIEEVVSTDTPFGSRLVGEFKYMKVVLAPAAIVRNMMSNVTLNWWKLGLGPWRLDKYAQALASLKNKDEWYERARKVGLEGSTYASQELKGILDDPLAASIFGKFGKKYDKVKHFMGDLYQKEESWAKLAAFRDAVERKGLSDDEAWKVAESATFNYAQVTPFIRKMRSALWGYPFITFPLKATPIVAETIAKNPARVSFFGKVKSAIEPDDEETRRERATEPKYIKDGFFVKLPFKDQHGRSGYFDMTYIIPFGDLLSGQLFERQLNRETGLEESPITTVASKNPALNFFKEIARNQDFYGNKIWKESDPMEQKLADLANHAFKVLTPPWVADQLPGGYDYKGDRVWGGFLKASEADSENQKRTIYQEMLRNLGLKVQPVEADIQDYINEINQKKGLQTLLLENNVVNEFSTVYVPKDKKD